MLHASWLRKRQPTISHRKNQKEIANWILSPMTQKEMKLVHPKQNLNLRVANFTIFRTPNFHHLFTMPLSCNFEMLPRFEIAQHFACVDYLILDVLRAQRLAFKEFCPTISSLSTRFPPRTPRVRTPRVRFRRLTIVMELYTLDQ